MQRYLAVRLANTSRRKLLTRKALAEEAKVHEATVCKWHAREDFSEWLAEETVRYARDLWPLVGLACTSRVLQTGDPREGEILGRMMGTLPAGYQPTQDPAAPATGAAPVVVNVLVPRPEYPVALETPRG